MFVVVVVTAVTLKYNGGAVDGSGGGSHDDGRGL